MKHKIKSVLKSILLSMPPKYRNNIVRAYAYLRGININMVKNREISISGDISLIRKVGHGELSFIFFPVIDWGFRVQRPQHLARELAKNGNKVIYLTTQFNQNKRPGFKIIENSNNNVIVCSLNLNNSSLNIYKDSLTKSDVSFLLHGLEILRQAFDLGYIQSVINLPFWRQLAEAIPASSIIYDCMDHHAGFENNDQNMLIEEELLFKSADLTITTAKRLSDLVSKYTENTIIRNAGDIEYFSREPEDIAFKKTRPVVGYYGAIAEWFDLELLIKCATTYYDYDFVIVGGVTIDVSSASKISNIKFLGEVPYKNLTQYLKGFDVCLIPFKLIELTLCTNPVKVYEYLAAGKPVVCTAMPEVQLIDDIVHVAKSHEQFIDLIDIAMSENNNKDLAKLRHKWSQEHDWKNRAEQLIELTKDLNNNLPKVSIVVLTFNNLDLTKDCLESIKINTYYRNFEVIIVDNLSTDGTREYLIENYSNLNNYKVILNDDNLGFAGGNNIGLEHSCGDILVILNNDTYVGPGWLGGLIHALKHNPDIGMVGPVTNNIGNESKINISYTNWSEMSSLATTYNTNHTCEIYPIDCLAFFCVAIRRDVYDKVGGLSLDYGLGFFEDDDYCMRVKEIGYKLAAVEYSFVHHHLSASFNKLKNNKKEELMVKNLAIFEDKWGEWKPHSYRKGVR